MAFKFSEKFNYFSQFNQQKEFKYFKVKTRHQEVFEMAMEIALKSVGTEDADNIRAEETFDGNLWGLRGSDTLHGDGRNNVIYGGSENDGRDGEDASRNSNRSSDNDTLWGYGGNDMLFGQSGRDILYSGDGDDYLYGGVDNDTLIADGSGKNILNGGIGVDAILLYHYDNQNPDEVWEFMDVGDRVFLQGQFMETSGIHSVETTLWNENVQMPHREARIQGDFYQSTEIKDVNGQTLFFIEGPTSDGITIGWNSGGMEVIGNNGNWDGAQFVYSEQLTGVQQWTSENWIS
jgi:hypothetical protein